KQQVQTELAKQGTEVGEVNGRQGYVKVGPDGRKVVTTANDPEALPAQERGHDEIHTVSGPTIGVSYRPDAFGTAHGSHDLKSLNQYSEGKPPGEALIPKTLPHALADLEFPEKPKDPSASKKREFDESVARINERVIQSRKNADAMSELSGLDGLYLTGAPSAIHKQDENGSKAINVPKPSEKAKIAERDSRADFEHSLLASARTLGMPVLAVCAGCWRVAEAYGGYTEVLPDDIRSRHYNPGVDTWKTSHGVSVEPNSFLSSTIPDASGELERVNSTHWASVGDFESAGKKLSEKTPARLKELQASQKLPSTPSDELSVAAREKVEAVGQVGHIEAFESNNGLVTGVQWHPESYLPGMPGFDGADEKSVRQADALFRQFYEKSNTYNNKKRVNSEIKNGNYKLLDFRHSGGASGNGK
ncbi:gamma-glutamyl-gamma-aminobutyrate hydrolase family protein, partial [Burkholderia ubonensis]